MIMIKKIIVFVAILFLSVIQLSARGDSITYNGPVTNDSLMDLPLAMRAGEAVFSIIADHHPNKSLLKAHVFLDNHFEINADICLIIR